MNYGYIRVSTDRQTVENQRYEITRFCEREHLSVDCWIEETISGTKEPEKRKLGPAMRRMGKGDVLVCAELSRLGRSLLMIMAILNECMKKEVRVWTVKEGYRLGSDISSKVLAFAFGISAEIERTLISQRTKEALARKRAEGVVLGHPKGVRNSRTKLTGKESLVLAMRRERASCSTIARVCRVHPVTISRFLKDACMQRRTLGGD